MALPATESFTDSDGVQLTTHSSDWTLNQGDFDIQSNAVCGDAWTDNFAHWNADEFDDDQYSEAVFAAIAAGHYDGVSVRVHASAVTCYFFYATTAVSRLKRVVAGSETQLGSDASSTWSVSDEIRIEAESTTITPLKNGSTTDTPGAQTDATIESGFAGIFAADDYTTTRLDDWEGGNLGAGSTASETATVGDSPSLSLGLEAPVVATDEGYWVAAIQVVG